MLDACGGVGNHAEHLFESFQRASGMLIAGLWHVPGYSHDFLLYLWNSLGAPVLQYGMELLSAARQLLKKEIL